MLHRQNCTREDALVRRLLQSDNIDAVLESLETEHHRHISPMLHHLTSYDGIEDDTASQSSDSVTDAIRTANINTSSPYKATYRRHGSHASTRRSSYSTPISPSNPEADTEMSLDSVFGDVSESASATPHAQRSRRYSSPHHRAHGRTSKTNSYKDRHTDKSKSWSESRSEASRYRVTRALQSWCPTALVAPLYLSDSSRRARSHRGPSHPRQACSSSSSSSSDVDDTARRKRRSASKQRSRPERTSHRSPRHAGNEKHTPHKDETNRDASQRVRDEDGSRQRLCSPAPMRVSASRHTTTPLISPPPDRADDRDSVHRTEDDGRASPREVHARAKGREQRGWSAHNSTRCEHQQEAEEEQQQERYAGNMYLDRADSTVQHSEFTRSRGSEADSPHNAARYRNRPICLHRRNTPLQSNYTTTVGDVDTMKAASAAQNLSYSNIAALCARTQDVEVDLSASAGMFTSRSVMMPSPVAYHENDRNNDDSNNIYNLDSSQYYTSGARESGTAVAAASYHPLSSMSYSTSVATPVSANYSRARAMSDTNRHHHNSYTSYPESNSRYNNNNQATAASSYFYDKNYTSTSAGKNSAKASLPSSPIRSHADRRIGRSYRIFADDVVYNTHTATTEEADDEESSYGDAMEGVADDEDEREVHRTAHRRRSSLPTGRQKQQQRQQRSSMSSQRDAADFLEEEDEEDTPPPSPHIIERTQHRRNGNNNTGMGVSSTVQDDDTMRMGGKEAQQEDEDMSHADTNRRRGADGVVDGEKSDSDSIRIRASVPYSNHRMSSNHNNNSNKKSDSNDKPRLSSLSSDSDHPLYAKFSHHREASMADERSPRDRYQRDNHHRINDEASAFHSTRSSKDDNDHDISYTGNHDDGRLDEEQAGAESSSSSGRRRRSTRVTHYSTSQRRHTSPPPTPPLNCGPALTSNAAAPATERGTENPVYAEKDSNRAVPFASSLCNGAGETEGTLRPARPPPPPPPMTTATTTTTTTIASSSACLSSSANTHRRAEDKGTALSAARVTSEETNPFQSMPPPPLSIRMLSERENVLCDAAAPRGSSPNDAPARPELATRVLSPPSPHEDDFGRQNDENKSNCVDNSDNDIDDDEDVEFRDPDDDPGAIRDSSIQCESRRMNSITRQAAAVAEAADGSSGRGFNRSRSHLITSPHAGSELESEFLYVDRRRSTQEQPRGAPSQRRRSRRRARTRHADIHAGLNESNSHSTRHYDDGYPYNSSSSSNDDDDPANPQLLTSKPLPSPSSPTSACYGCRTKDTQRRRRRRGRRESASLTFSNTSSNNNNLCYDNNSSHTNLRSRSSMYHSGSSDNSWISNYHPSVNGGNDISGDRFSSSLDDEQRSLFPQQQRPYRNNVNDNNNATNKSSRRRQNSNPSVASIPPSSIRWDSQPQERGNSVRDMSRMDNEPPTHRRALDARVQSTHIGISAETNRTADSSLLSSPQRTQLQQQRQQLQRQQGIRPGDSRTPMRSPHARHTLGAASRGLQPVLLYRSLLPRRAPSQAQPRTNSFRAAPAHATTQSSTIPPSFAHSQERPTERVSEAKTVPVSTSALASSARVVPSQAHSHLTQSLPDTQQRQQQPQQRVQQAQSALVYPVQQWFGEFGPSSMARSSQPIVQKQHHPSCPHARVPPGAHASGTLTTNTNRQPDKSNKYSNNNNASVSSSVILAPDFAASTSASAATTPAPEEHRAPSIGRARSTSRPRSETHTAAGSNNEVETTPMYGLVGPNREKEALVWHSSSQASVSRSQNQPPPPPPRQQRSQSVPSTQHPARSSHETSNGHRVSLSRIVSASAASENDNVTGSKKNTSISNSLSVDSTMRNSNGMSCVTHSMPSSSLPAPMSHVAGLGERAGGVPPLRDASRSRDGKGLRTVSVETNRGEPLVRLHGARTAAAVAPTEPYREVQQPAPPQKTPLRIVIDLKRVTMPSGRAGGSGQEGRARAQRVSERFSIASLPA